MKFIKLIEVGESREKLKNPVPVTVNVDTIAYFNDETEFDGTKICFITDLCITVKETQEEILAKI